MEPFGLFDFLSSLLSSPSQNADSSPTPIPTDGVPSSAPTSMEENTQRNAFENGSQNTPQSRSAQNAATEKENAPPAEIDPTAQNAFLQFLEAHDERAKRTRRR